MTESPIKEHPYRGKRKRQKSSFNVALNVSLEWRKFPVTKALTLPGFIATFSWVFKKNLR
jgi:hypothetical protein